jgi:HEPN domain-containing protein
LSNRKITKQWLLYSIRDLKQAQKILTMGPEMKYGAAFHAQQCVEKAVKAYLVNYGMRPPRIHDIEKLGQVTAEINLELAKLVKKSKRLTRFAVAYRYPDNPDTELKSVSFSTIKSHVKMAKVIYDFVLQLIQE